MHVKNEKSGTIFFFMIFLGDCFDGWLILNDFSFTNELRKQHSDNPNYNFLLIILKTTKQQNEIRSTPMESILYCSYLIIATLLLAAPTSPHGARRTPSRKASRIVLSAGGGAGSASISLL